MQGLGNGVEETPGPRGDGNEGRLAPGSERRQGRLMFHSRVVSPWLDPVTLSHSCHPGAYGISQRGDLQGFGFSSGCQ